MYTSFFLVATVALAQIFQPPAANVAKGAAYTLSPPPNYQYCTEPGDATQLTDGVYTEGHFWIQPTTVGWQNARPVLIVIDLGADKPIRGVSYTTAAGAAGVYWPSSIQIFAGDDSKQFHWIGDLVTMSARKQTPPLGVYATHRFWTDEIKSHGRYVALAVLSEPYTFVDEVEVYEGDAAWLNAPLEGEPIADIAAYTTGLGMRVAVQRRIQQDIDAIRGQATSPGVSEAIRAAVVTELDGVQSGLADLAQSYPTDFKTILPLNDLHARVFRAQAKLWSESLTEPLLVWDCVRTPKWTFRTPYDPPQREDAPTIRIDAMQNEFRSGAFYLANTTPDDVEVALRFVGLPGGATPPYVEVHEATWTDTRMGVPVEAALPLARRESDHCRIALHSGLTRQVWLTIHSVDLEPGEYAGNVQIESPLGNKSVGIQLRVHPLRFPDRPRLHCGGWDYTDQPSMYGVTPENREALVAFLKDHFIDSPWGTSAVLPLGSYDADGHMSKQPSTAHFDEWIARWSGAAQYCVFASVSDHLGSLAMGTLAFENAAKEWISFWADHIRKSGLQPEQFAVLLYDEPSTPEQDAIIAAWVKPLHEAASGIRCWVDPTHRTMAVTESVSIASCDVVCPNRQIFYQAEQPYRDFFASLPATGKTLEFYSCSGPVRVLDPYSYHRLQPWDCWRYAARASYFWAFGDTGGGSAWNEYAAKGTCYTPLFLDEESVTTGKHMEAVREGIEDYEYLAMLGDAVELGATLNADPVLLQRARELLAGAPTKVTDECFKNAGFGWKEPMDRGAADAIRLEILEILDRLGADKSK